MSEPIESDALVPRALTVVKRFDDLPCSHRQWRADNHCAYLHGYSRSFTFTFACEGLSPEGWVVDFGGLKELRAWLQMMFDHTTLISADDPELPTFEDLDARGLIALRVVPNVAAESLAHHVWRYANDLVRKQTDGRAWVIEVEARENHKNAAVFRADR